MIKLLFDDNDFKIALPSDFFFQLDDNNNFFTNRRAYTSYHIIV
jgi:hypothetical protein